MTAPCFAPPPQKKKVNVVGRYQISSHKAKVESWTLHGTHQVLERKKSWSPKIEGGEVRYVVNPRDA